MEVKKDITVDDNKNQEKIANERIQHCLAHRDNHINLSNLGLTAAPVLLQVNAKQLNQHLTSLDLSGNQVAELEGLSELTGLTKLHLGDNQITEVERLSGLTNLTALNLNRNQIIELKGLSGLIKLTGLGLNGNQIIELKELATLTALTNLYLNNNQIVKLEGLSELTGLTILDLSHNQINGLESFLRLTRLTTLTTLDLSFNQIVKLEGLSGLTGITDLHLGTNQIVELDSLSALIGLTRLNLSENKITELTEISGLTGLTVLDSSHNHITELESLSTLTGLTVLDVSFNKIINLEGLSELTRLTELDVSHNQLTKLTSLSGLIGLTELYLGDNHITELEGLSELTGLIKLHLGGNQITELKNISGLIRLTVLDVSHNHITELKELIELTALTRLNLDYNKVTELKELSELTALTRIDLNHNKVSDINTIKNIIDSNCREDILIKIASNPFWQHSNITPNDDLNANHYDDLKLYFAKQASEISKVIVNLPKKVVFLGNHASGKSSALHYLKHKELSKKGKKSTHVLGIEYLHLSVTDDKLDDKLNNKLDDQLNNKLNDKLDEKTDNNIDGETKLETNFERKVKAKGMFHASCYDFGGQDFYHGIYRIFLNNASVAVLLINPKYNLNSRASQNSESTQGEMGKQLTQYFDVRYWRGLLNYMQHKKQSTDEKLALFTIQSHAEQGQQADWSLPAILSKPVAVHVADADSHSHNNNEKQKNKAIVHDDNPTSPIYLAGFHHLNLKYTTDSVPLPTRPEFFYQQFATHIKQKQTEIELPAQEVDFLKSLMNKANEVISDCQPTTFKDIIDNELNFLTLETLQTQIRQYNRAGMLLYDERLSANQSAGIKNLQEHIAWLNPQGLVTFIHKNILSQKSLIDRKGIISKADFNSAIREGLSTLKESHRDAIVELLEIHQVIFKHNYSDGTKDIIEYIIPNYLPLANDDSSYELIYDGMGEPSFCITFTDFIPVGMINQFVNLFGKQPDKKLFWRDVMIFNLSDGNRKLFKVHLQVDMKNLTINVHITDLLAQGKTKIISYLYYCIINAYWSYLTSLTAIKYKDFEVKNQQKSVNKKSDKPTGLFQETEASIQYASLLQHADGFVQKLFSDNDQYIPNDMYISLDGKNFVKYDELLEENVLNVSCYHQKKSENDTETNTTHTIYDNSKRMIRQIQPVDVQYFQPFTNKKLKKVARIFISYSHLDREYKEALMVHLRILERHGHHIFDDTKIGHGKFDERIQDELKTSDIVLFLMSANFFNSEYIFHKEMTKVLDNQNREGKKQVVIPVLMKDFDYQMLSSVITDDFTQKNLEKLTSVDGVSRNESLMKECGRYLFRPYYRDSEDGTGRILPIENWKKDERNNAYAQVAQLVRHQIEKL